MFQRFSYLADGGPTLIGEFEASKVPMKKFDTPVFLKCFYFSADIGMAGVETLCGPAKVSFFRKNKSEHKSLSGDMGEHASPEGARILTDSLNKPVSTEVHINNECGKRRNLPRGKGFFYRFRIFF